MEKNIYLKPAIKVLDTCSDELMFEPGGGVSLEPNPVTPGVGAKENSSEYDDFDYPSYGNVWDN